MNTAPVVLEIPALRMGDVVVHDCATFGCGRGLGEGHVVGGGRDGAGAAGEKHGDEGLFEKVVVALAGEKFTAPEFETLPVEIVGTEAAEADVDERGEGASGEFCEHVGRVAVGGFTVHGVQRAVGLSDPCEQEIGFPKKKKVGVQNEFPTGGTDVWVDKFSQVGIVEPAVAKAGEAREREHFIEAGLGL
jgi:hypothetical protein